MRGIDGDELAAIVPELDSVEGEVGEWVLVAVAESFVAIVFRCSDAVRVNDGDETVMVAGTAMGESLSRAVGIE